MTNYVWRLSRVFQEEVLAIPGRVIALAFIILLFLLPLVTKQPHLLRMLTLTAIFAIFASSWDLLAGFTGQLNLGQALFFGVSAYTAALLNIHLGLPPWVTVPIGSIAAIGTGLIVGLPALRIRGFYLALVTLTFPIILSGIIYIFPKVTGGELGIYGVDKLSQSSILDYYIILVVMVASLAAMFKFTDTESKIVRIGIIICAIRGDEITARASGINTTNYKLLSFAVSGFFAGIAGGFYAHFMRIAGPSTLEVLFSFQVILWTIFGGISTIFGAVTGTYILYPLLEIFRLFPAGEKLRFIFFSILLIVTMLFMPEGIATWVRDKIEVRCPRCKLINSATRRICRACRAPLHVKSI
jgi:branched-chain amino acid transport system permease protein